MFVIKVTYGNGEVSILRIFSLDEVSQFDNDLKMEFIIKEIRK